MKTIIQNIIAIISGWLIGAVANMGLIIIGGMVVPMIDGMDPMNATNWPIKYFLFPFLAHAFGTFMGAFVAAKIAKSYRKVCVMSVVIFFLFGGILMVRILPAPLWFAVLDLFVAYIPMGWLGWKLNGK